MSEEDKIFEEIRLGNRKAFETVFRNYYQELCNYAYQFFHDKDTVEEIVQDLFFKLWSKKETIIIRTSLRSYLYKAVYNNTMLFLRKKNTRSVTGELTDDIEQKLIVEPEIPIQTKELDQIIQVTIQLMPAKVRQIFELSRLEGLRYKDIAEKLSISVKTVEANMGRALKLFRQNLKKYLEVRC